MADCMTWSNSSVPSAVQKLAISVIGVTKSSCDILPDSSAFRASTQTPCAGERRVAYVCPKCSAVGAEVRTNRLTCASVVADIFLAALEEGPAAAPAAAPAPGGLGLPIPSTSA